MYINTTRHTDKIVEEIKSFAGEDASLIIGDWGGKGKISYISTPNIGFQRRLKRDFKARYILTNTIPQKFTTRQRRKHKT